MKVFNCGTCGAWEKGIDQKSRMGLCRRKAPVIIPTSTDGWWPRTNKNDFCSEWVDPQIMIPKKDKDSEKCKLCGFTLTRGPATNLAVCPNVACKRCGETNEDNNSSCHRCGGAIEDASTTSDTKRIRCKDQHCGWTSS